uniref:Uncharacterized protein n=1 Tax=viral metagenome TaxID=1070528 RepID=A0A6M3LMQ6_9ZZZZ
MKLGNYLKEVTKMKKSQKDDLTHFIINTLTNVETARILKKIKQSKTDEITISKKDAETIIQNLARIRQFILDIQIEEKEK